MLPDTNLSHPNIVVDVPSHHREPALNLGTYSTSEILPIKFGTNSEYAFFY